VSEVAGRILRPISKVNKEAPVNISGGWRNQRMRFILRVVEQNQFNPHEETSRIFYGYSDRVDVSYGGHPAPDTRLYFNSEMTIRRTYEPTPRGSRWFAKPIGSNQIITPQDMGLAPGANTLGKRNINYLIRPEDVYYYGQSNAVNAQLERMGNFSSADIIGRYDTRAMSGTYRYSRRQDTSPSRYVHRVMEGMRHSLREKEMDGDIEDDELYYEAADRVRNATIQDTTFFKLLRTETGYMESGYVTVDELQDIFPEIGDRDVTIVGNPRSDAGVRRLYNAYDTNEWTGHDNVDVAASVVAQTFPAIMMDNLIRSVHVVVTNGRHGEPYAMYIPEDDNGDPQILFIEDGLDQRDLVDELFRRLEIDILNTITYNGTESFDLAVYADLAGDCSIQIRVGESKELHFVSPAFSDSLFSPVITSDQQHARNMASDFVFLLDQVMDTSPHGTQIVDTRGRRISSEDDVRIEKPRSYSRRAKRDYRGVLDSL
jgi:hypothetical protein